MKHPEPREIWVKRKTGERFEVRSVFERWVIVYPERSGNRRPVHVITHNFPQEFLPAEEDEAGETDSTPAGSAVAPRARHGRVPTDAVETLDE
jgi:hypothetical protein